MHSGDFDLDGSRAIESGFDWSLSFVINADGVPMDLTGYTALFEARRGPTDTPVISLTSPTGITLSGSGTGSVLITLTAAATKDIAPGQYRFDFCLQNGPHKYRYFKGFIDVNDRVIDTSA